MPRALPPALRLWSQALHSVGATPRQASKSTHPKTYAAVYKAYLALRAQAGMGPPAPRGATRPKTRKPRKTAKPAARKPRKTAKPAARKPRRASAHASMY